ncbi:MAG: TRAP transporter substrate-binding protein [Nitrospinales bacterium]
MKKKVSQMNLWYRSLIVIIGLLLITTTTQAITWRLATKVPPESPDGMVFQRFAELTEKYTDGKLTVQIFPSEQLGGTEAILEQVSAGTVHLYGEDASWLSKWVPDISYMDSVFIFDSREHWLRFGKSELAKEWFDKARKKSGITFIGEFGKMLRGPYRVIVSRKPVKTLNDLQGLKLRMYDDKLAVKIWTHLGARVRVIGWTDVYQSMQTGIIEAVTSPVALVESMKFFEVAPNISRTNEFYQANALLVNEGLYKGLSEELRAGVIRAFDEASAYSHEIMNEVTDKSIERMKAKGATFSEIERAPFVERMKEFYKKTAEEGELPDGFLEAVEATR